MMPLATFGNFFGPDMLIIFLIILVLFGAKKLPELARGLGQSLNEFKKAREDFEHELKQGQKDVQVQGAEGRQPYSPAAVPANAALPYTAPVQAASVTESEAALQQRIHELEQRLQAAQEEQVKPAVTHVG